MRRKKITHRHLDGVVNSLKFHVKNGTQHQKQHPAGEFVVAIVIGMVRVCVYKR